MSRESQCVPRQLLQVRLSRNIMWDDEFEWDDVKAAANLANHKVSFVDARRAFGDYFAVERDDDRQRYSEERSTLIGMVGDRLLCVAYTMREHRIRIISARYAEPFERRLYHDGNTQD